jgi:hypothetical protein
VLFLGFGRIALPPLFPRALSIANLDRIGRALHAMGKIAKQFDPEAEMDLPDKPRACTGADTTA